MKRLLFSGKNNTQDLDILQKPSILFQYLHAGELIQHNQHQGNISNQENREKSCATDGFLYEQRAHCEFLVLHLKVGSTYILMS